MLDIFLASRSNHQTLQASLHPLADGSVAFLDHCSRALQDSQSPRGWAIRMPSFPFHEQQVYGFNDTAFAVPAMGQPVSPEMARRMSSPVQGVPVSSAPLTSTTGNSCSAPRMQSHVLSKTYLSTPPPFRSK